MTPDSTELRRLLGERVICQAFVERLTGPGNDNGAVIVAAIGEFCGANEQDPARIKPELVAFWNWFLSRLGLRREASGNLTNATAYQDFIAESRAVLSMANVNDLDRAIGAERQRLEEQDARADTDPLT